MRPARKDESRSIAELFEISSDGVASYVWSMLQADYPGLPLLEIGRRRYEREGTAFSYQNCLMAEDQGEVRGMMHAYAAPPPGDPAPAPRPVDPVLRPYSELEAPGTLYIAGIAVWPSFRGQGVGTRFLEAARERARGLGSARAEPALLCGQYRREAPVRAGGLRGGRLAPGGAARHDPPHWRRAAHAGAGLSPSPHKRPSRFGQQAASSTPA